MIKKEAKQIDAKRRWRRSQRGSRSRRGKLCRNFPADLLYPMTPALTAFGIVIGQKCGFEGGVCKESRKGR
jgi:hypothetical protein